MLRDGQISSEELTRAYIERAQSTDSSLGAFITLDAEGALKRARQSDSRRALGHSSGRLDGIVYAAKDNIMTKGMRTTCASKMLENFTPMYDATVIQKLCSGGAVLLGKTNMDEFAMGSTGENSAFFPCKNPCDRTKVPGGSSSGSAAATAAGAVSFALGSDTGGSVRLPAAYCGVIGLKPTRGSVSRYGLAAFASSLDVIGPICRTVEDCALVYDEISGADARDATSIMPCVDTFGKLRRGIEGFRVALPRELFALSIDGEIREAVEKTAKMLESLGAEVCEVSIPGLTRALYAYYIISSAEASSNLARYDGIRYGYRTEKRAESIEQFFSMCRGEAFGDEVKRRILLGAFVLSEGYSEKYYKRATAVAAELCRELDALFCEYDIILTPTSAQAASRIGESGGVSVTKEYEKDAFTVFANLCGHPALSMPCAVDREGMPIGVQLTAARGREDKLLCAARAIEIERGEMEVRRDI